MSGFETLIRDTIAKQGEPTHAVRTRVYASARSALERMISSRGEEGGAGATQQREALEEAIARIEAEHAAAAPVLADPVEKPVQRSSYHAPDPTPSPEPPSPKPPAPPPPVAPPAASQPAPVPPVDAPGEPRIVDPGPLAPVNYAPAGRVASGSGRPDPGRVDPSQVDPDRVDPVLGEPIVSPARPRDAKAAAQARREADRLLDGRPRRKPWVLLLLWTIVLAGLGTAAWWGWTFGRSTIESIAIPPEPSEIIAPPRRVGENDAGWINVFDPAGDIASVVADGGTSELVDGFMRIAAPQAGTGVKVRVPPGVMQALRGRSATFEVTVRSAQGTHSFAVLCEFGTEPGCGRKRFEATQAPTPFLFDADLTQAAGEGTLLFVPDLEGQGRAIDVERIRARAP